MRLQPYRIRIGDTGPSVGQNICHRYHRVYLSSQVPVESVLCWRHRAVVGLWAFIVGVLSCGLLGQYTLLARLSCGLLASWHNLDDATAETESVLSSVHVA